MKRNARDLVNMLAAAVVVLIALLLALGVHACRNTEEAREKRARTLRGNTPETETHTLSTGAPSPLPLPSASSPLTAERLAQVQSSLIVLAPTLDGAEPIFSASPGLWVSPAVLAPLGELAAAFHRARPSETLYVTAAFRADPASPFATGYAVSLAVRRPSGKGAGAETNSRGTAGAAAGTTVAGTTVAGTAVAGAAYTADGSTETVPLTDLPDAAAYLAAVRARYGFIAVSESGADLCYIGYPHATLMEERRLTPSQYLTYLSLFSQGEPLTAAAFGNIYRLFYLPAEDGRASLTLPRDTPFSALPVGAAGFLVVLPGDT